MDKFTTIPTKASLRTANAARAKPPAKRKRNRAGRPTMDELERRKLRVMEVATDMFVSRGYAATTLLDIAKTAGVATRTLYQHFGDKEAIFREVIFARDTARIDPPTVEDDDDLVSALRKAAYYSFNMALRPRSIELMRLMIAECTRFPELITQVASRIFTRFQGNIAVMFGELAAKGVIPDGDHTESAELYTDLLLGNHTVMVYFGWTSEFPTDKDIDLKIKLFVNGRFPGMGFLDGKKTKPAKPAKLVKRKA